MPGPGSQHGSSYLAAEPPGIDSGGTEGRNPLVCCICEDYFSEPCLLQCYHTFCAKCLRGREVEGRIPCPVCGTLTILKENSCNPPSDLLIKQLIEVVNAENPPCANCDKRDRHSMYFCSTCGQALCSSCRDNTHRAKMFAAHEVVHMSKCANENQRRCPIHGEQYIMFNNAHKSMLCMTCFRDTPAETRMHCVDMETAYLQCGKKLDRAVVAVCDVQNSVREGLLMVKTLLEELRRNSDCEKHTINTFCQGMQEAIAKTHSNMIMEVQRQYEMKERTFRGQFISLGTMLPVIQHHLRLCHNFTSIANKYQFVDLAFPMIDRLMSITHLNQPLRAMESSQIRTNYRGEFAQALDPFISRAGHPVPPVEPSFEPAMPASHPPPSKRQQNALRAKALEGEGPFSNHCRSFENQVKELSQQLVIVKERLGELHRDVALLRRAQTPPLLNRYHHITAECALLEEQLERHQVELERMKSVFDTLWEEQLCRIHVEQDIFHCQMNEILNLRGEVKHLSAVAQQLEPFIKSLTTSLQQLPQQKTPDLPKQQDPQQGEPSMGSQQLQAILEHINQLQLESQKLHKVTSPDGRERSRTPSQSPGAQLSAILDSAQPSSSRGVISQLMDKVRAKEDRKKSPEDRDRALPRERSKSDGRAELIRAKAAIDSTQGKQPPPVKTKSKKERYGTPGREGKVSAIYQSISGRVLGNSKVEDAQSGRVPPPPPPARRGPPPEQPPTDIRDLLDAHLKERLEEMMRSGVLIRNGAPRPEKSLSLDAPTMEEYQRMSELIHEAGEERKSRGHGRRGSQSKSGSTATSPKHRDEHRERSRERRERSRDRRDHRDRSQQRDRSREHRDKSRSRERSSEGSGRERSKERRRDKYGRCYPASDTEEACMLYGRMSRKQNSCDSLTISTDSRKSSQTDLGDRKTLVLVIGGGSNKGSKQKMIQKQRSWETFPPKKKSSLPFDSTQYGRGPPPEPRPASAQDGRRGHHEIVEGTLRKADSFEGHEEAVRTLVAAVHQTRHQTQLARKKSAGHVSN